MWSPKQFLLKNPQTDLLRLIPSELQHQNSKPPVAYRGELKYLASRREVGDSFLLVRKAGRGHCPFSELSAHKATEPQSQQVGAIPDSPPSSLTHCPRVCSAHPGDPLRLYSTQVVNNDISM